jgi:CHAT domain/Effector-associated domain 2
LIYVPSYQRHSVAWLAVTSGLSFSRRLYQTEQRQLKQIKKDEPLKIALMVSRPTGRDGETDRVLGHFDSSKVEAKLSELQANGLIDVIKASSKNLSATLKEKQPHIFHFIGHGRLNDDAGQLAFVIDVGGPNFGKPDWKAADDVVELFPVDSLPQVVILQACEGARQSESDAFASVASKLLLRGIPIVVAMQYEIPAGVANQFVCRLYEEIIVQKNPVEIAVQEARNAIAQGYERPDFATPVIYMNVADGQLFEEAIALSTSNPEQIEQKYPFKFIFKNLSFERKNALVGVFLKCESLNNRTSRTRMIEALIPPIPGRVEREGKPRDVVFSILEECDKRNGGFRSFLKALKEEEEDSSDFQEVEKAIKDLPD